jgi:hypothetical protein
MTEHYDYQTIYDNERREELIRLRAENARLAAELAAAREAWREFVDLMEPVESHMDCICLDPPGYDDDDERNENDPSNHSQYCIMYLKAYAEAKANGTDVPE